MVDTAGASMASLAAPGAGPTGQDGASASDDRKNDDTLGDSGKKDVGVTKEAEEAEKEETPTAVTKTQEEKPEKKEEGQSEKTPEVERSPTPTKRLAPLKPVKRTSVKLSPLKSLKPLTDETQMLSSGADAGSANAESAPSRTSPLPRRSLKKYQVEDAHDEATKTPEQQTRGDEKKKKSIVDNKTLTASTAAATQKTTREDADTPSTTGKDERTTAATPTQVATPAAADGQLAPESVGASSPCATKAEAETTASLPPGIARAKESGVAKADVGTGGGNAADALRPSDASPTSAAVMPGLARKSPATADCPTGRHAHLGNVDWDSWATVDKAIQASTSGGAGACGKQANEIVVVLFAVPWSPTSLYVAESLDEARACGELAKVAMFIVNADACMEKAWELGVESPLPTVVLYSGGTPLRWRRPTRETSVRLDHGITRRNITSVVRCAFDASGAGKNVASLAF